MSNRERAGPPAGDGGVTLEGLHTTVKEGFGGVRRQLNRIARSMKGIEVGLADVGEFQEKVGRAKTFVRQRQIQSVLERMNARPGESIPQAAAAAFEPLTGGYPTASALASACYRVGIGTQVGAPPG